MKTIEAPTLGEAWLEVSRAVLEHGDPAVYDDQATRSFALVTVVVAEPCSDDPIVAELGDPEWLGAPLGLLVIHVTSAHIYEPERELMRRLVGASGAV